MSYKFSSRHILLCLAAFAVGPATAALAENPGRLAIANRQRVESMVGIAQSDGSVSAEERQEIISTARNTFSTSEIQGLDAYLSTSAAGRQPSHAASNARLASLMTQPTAKPSSVFQFAGFAGTKETASEQDETISATNYQIHSCDACWAGEDCSCCGCEQQGWSGNCWDNISLHVGVDGFKGPMDLDNHNGNFGVRYGINAAFPLLEMKNIGIQAGTSEVTSNFHGTDYTGSSCRMQNFTTVGLFQRYPNMAPRFSWGFAYDWLTDDYYATMHMGQWRLKFAYDLSCASELGVWVCIPDHGDDVHLGSEQHGYTVDNFRPITQCNVYLRRYFDSGMAASIWIGGAEAPGNFIIGADSTVPITQRASLYGGFQYILPSASGVAGQEDEMWNLGVGLTFTLGPCGNGGRPSLYKPFMDVADNGIFSVRRR